VRAQQAWYGPDVMLAQMVWQWCQQFRDRRMSVLDDARPHTAAATINHIATFGWERLDQAPYSPDLAPSDFHFFSTLKRTYEGHHEDVEAAVQIFVHTRTLTFTNRGSSSLGSGGTNASMSVVTMLKNCRLMQRSAHISVYLVHAVSCRWRTSETYFPTIPRTIPRKVNMILVSSPQRTK
jgi:hypothetical protein